MSYWFRPKRYGYGATPNTWQGWLFTFGFVALIAVVSVLLEPGQIASSGVGRLIGLAAAALATALFVWITWKKTDGAWHWRWGSRER
jgi:hypothetical protein